jgi:CelD/BcsL family acetyltransferase involved in cellulose biosynthesis
VLVRKLTSAADFVALRADWDRLVAANPAATVFQSWEWLYSWWETYGSAHRLQLLVVSDENGIVCGIAPLMSRWSRIGLVPVRTLEFIGAHSVASEYLDFVTMPGVEHEVAAAIMSHLAEASGWDLFRFYQLADGSATRRVILEAAAAQRLHLSPGKTQPSLYVPLPSSWETYLARMRPHARKNLRQYLRRIEAAGTYEFVEQSNDGAPLTEFERLHKARMAHTGRVTTFDSPLFVAFHQRVAARCAERGWLRLFFLRHEGRNVAGLYAFAVNGRMFFYNSGFEPSAGNQNVGAALLGRCIERCIVEGMSEFDFLGPGEYKERWAVEERQKFTFSVSRRPLIIAAERLSQRGWESVRSGIARLIPATVYRLLGDTYRQLGVRFNRPLR